MLKHRKMLLLVALLALISVPWLQSKSAQGNNVSPLLFPYNQASGINYNVTDLTQAWNEWKSNMITANNAGGGNRLRVMGGVDSSSTVSEGQGYGILFASIFDDQNTLDGLWLFTRDHLDPNGLMHWHIGNPGQLRGSYAATDGDEDIALGLVNACVKVRKGVWQASSNGLDYCGLATTMINNIYTYEVDHPGSSPIAGLPNNPGNELLPGDGWNLTRDYPEGIVNLSYFSPGYFTVFGKFTGKTSEWEAVNSRNYEITNLAQSRPGNCSKLVPNWNQYDGDAQLVSWQPEEYAWWSYDAARFAWRVAVDKAWYNTASSRETMNEVGGFFSSVGIENVQARYRMNGTSVDNYRGVFFVANAAAAIWAAPAPQAVNCGAATGQLKTSPQQAYNMVLATKDSPNSYYVNAWRLMSMLLLTGNFPNIYELANGVTPTSTPLPTNTTVPATSTTIPATSTPVPTNVLPTSTPVPTNVLPTNTPVPTNVLPTNTAIPTIRPTNTPVPTSVPPTNTPIAGACQITYTISNDWGSGFTADVSIRNNGAAINSWNVAWSFAGNQQITNLWNGVVSQTGQNVSVNSAGWNGSIASGGTASFGFQGTYSGSNPKPSSISLNGTACSVAP
ncbi:glycosyl hydrolase family 8 [Herpetosiphon llansteffanensis]